MVDTPELTSMTRHRTVQPLVAAWIFVIVALAAVFIWLTLSTDAPAPALPETDNPETASQIIPAPEQEAETGSPAPAEVSNDADSPMSSHVPTERVSLAKAPIEGLVMMGANGPLPVLGPDSLVSWKAYARPVTTGTLHNKPEIAIVITGIGLNSKATDLAIKKLPGEIDLAFSPYGQKLQQWMDQARQYGHEGFLMIPTEPLKYPENDPGPHTLLAGAPLRDNLKKLDWLLSQVTGYVGVINEMGSKFTTSEEDLLPILKDLKARGLMMLDSRSTRFSLAAKLARRISMPRAINSLYLDNVISRAKISQNLTRLENTAHTYGVAVGVARAMPLTISEIRKWSEQLDARGFRLVPITAIANRQPVR